MTDDDNTTTRPATEHVTEDDLAWAQALFEHYERHLSGRADEDQDRDR